MPLRIPTNLRLGTQSYVRDLPGKLQRELRAELMVEAYRRRRDAYALLAQQRQLVFRPDEVVENTRARLQSRGINVVARPSGAPVHTLAFVPSISWHGQLLQPLASLGLLSHFDYEAHGLRYLDIAARTPSALAARRHACSEFEQFAERVSKERRVDWVFVYATGLEVLRPTLARVREITGAPVVGMCLDDKQSWETSPWGEQRGGQIDLAGELDLAWTSARVACEWYLVEGGNPLFLGEGCSPDIFAPGGREKRHDVCFIGQAYGFRRAFVERLRRSGVTVRAAGKGWPDGALSESEMIQLLQHSKIILGLGGIGWSEELKNVKGRDFDSPCAGPYVTSYNPDLASFFEIGREIACFSTSDEAVDLVRLLLHDERLRAALADAGRRRCLRDHTWQRRFQQVLEVLGIWR